MNQFNPTPEQLEAVKPQITAAFERGFQAGTIAARKFNITNESTFADLVKVQVRIAELIGEALTTIEGTTPPGMIPSSVPGNVVPQLLAAGADEVVHAALHDGSARRQEAAKLMILPVAGAA